MEFRQGSVFDFYSASEEHWLTEDGQPVAQYENVGLH